MLHDSRSDTVAPPIRSPYGRREVIRPEDLVWPPPLEDLQAFSVIKVGEDDEQAESILIVAGLAAPEHPLPKTPAPAPARTAPASRPPARPTMKPASARAVARTRATTGPRVVVPPDRPTGASPFALPRWMRVWLFAVGALVMVS